MVWVYYLTFSKCYKCQKLEKGKGAALFESGLGQTEPKLCVF